MSSSFIVQNELMNQPNYHQDIYTNIMKQALINQISQQCYINQMNFFLSIQLFQNMQFFNNQNNIGNNQSFSNGKKRNKFTQPYANNIINNEFLPNINSYLQQEALRNNYVLNQYKREALQAQNKEKIYIKENIQENLITNENTYSCPNTAIYIPQYDSQKETKILKNEYMMNKEDDDIDEMNTYIIQNNRRFSHRSKRSDNSDNSNCSKSTQDTSNEIQTYKSKKDVSSDDKNLIKNEEVENKHKTNPAFENTVILCVKVKISEKNTAIFKLKRFDDIFVTIQYFCEINNLDEKYIKPLIIKSLCAINTIYKVMNCEIDKNNLEVLKQVKNNI